MWYQGVCLIMLRLGDYILTQSSSSKHIFFDGGLPTNKTGTRKSRLEANLKQLVVSRRTSSNGFNVSSHSAHAPPVTASQLFDSTRSSQLSTKVLPASPFLIPAILDSLSRSLYAAVTSVVLGEADVFCARAVSEWGGTILTNDSDLLVYNLGTHGGVVFLDQLEIREAHGTSSRCNKIRASVNKTSEISSRLGVDDFRSIAFEIRKDSHISFAEAINRAELRDDDNPNRESLQSFFDEYDIKPSNLESCQALATGTLNGLFLDARNSELIVSGSVYLPFLIDDPSRTSAWDVSRQLRLFAYSCLALGIAHFPKTVSEHGRRGARIAENRVQTLSYKNTVAFAKTLIESLESFEDSVSDLCKQHFWRLYATHGVYKWYLDEDKSPPPESSFMAAYAGITTGDKLTWFDIHVSAQLQAFMYAFRALKQFLSYLYLNIKADGRTILPAELWAVQTSLSSLPSINELMPSRLELATQSLPPTTALLASSKLASRQEKTKMSDDDISSLPRNGGIDNEENEWIAVLGVRQSGNLPKTCHEKKEKKEDERRGESKFATKKRQSVNKSWHAQHSTTRTTTTTTTRHRNMYDLLPPSG